MKRQPPILLVAMALAALFVLPSMVSSQLLNRREEARQAFRATPEGIYRHYCAHCHGDEGKGDGTLWSAELSPAPADLTSLEADKQSLVVVIRDGSAAVGKSNLCPAWGRTISRQDIDRLAEHLLSLGERPGDEPALEAEAAGTRPPWSLMALVLAEVVFLWWILRRRLMRQRGQN